MEQIILVMIGVSAIASIGYKVKKSAQEGSCSGCPHQGGCCSKSE